MAGEEKKDFNAMLREDKGMPRVQVVTDRATIEKYGGERMFFAPPLQYDQLMRRVPWGYLTTVGEMRSYLARKNGADFTEPITAGCFVSIAAWASEQRGEDPTPYWRTLKAGGQLNEKYPGGVERRKGTPLRGAAASISATTWWTTKRRWLRWTRGRNVTKAIYPVDLCTFGIDIFIQLDPPTRYNIA